MPSKAAPKPDDPTQFQRFLDMAEEVEADLSPGGMDKVFEKLRPALKQPRAPKGALQEPCCR